MSSQFGMPQHARSTNGRDEVIYSGEWAVEDVVSAGQFNYPPAKTATRRRRSNAEIMPMEKLKRMFKETQTVRRQRLPNPASVPTDATIRAAGVANALSGDTDLG